MASGYRLPWTSCSPSRKAAREAGGILVSFGSGSWGMAPGASPPGGSAPADCGVFGGSEALVLVAGGGGGALGGSGEVVGTGAGATADGGVVTGVARSGDADGAFGTEASGGRACSMGFAQGFHI